MKYKKRKRMVSISAAIENIEKARHQLQNIEYDGLGIATVRGEGQFINTKYALNYYIDCLVLALKEGRI